MEQPQTTPSPTVSPAPHAGSFAAPPTPAQAPDGRPVLPAPPPAPTAPTPLFAALRGLAWFGVYLGARLLVDVPFSLFIAMRSMLAVGFENLELLMQDILLRAQHGGILLTAIINVAALGAFAIILRARKKPVLASVGIVPVPFSSLALLIPLGVSLNILLASAFALLPQEWLASYAEASNALLQQNVSLFSALTIALLAPLTEEVLFRGLVYTRFRSGMRAWAAILFSSVLFGVMHMQPVWMAYAACVGALLCMAMERYQSLLAPIVLHMSFNAAGMLTPLLQALPALFVLLVALGASVALGRRCLFRPRC